MSLHRTAPLLLALLPGCLGVDTPDEAPPLAGFDEPVEWLVEPDDEAERRALPAGGFTGLYVADARRTLEALVSEPEGLVVSAVVENGPGHAAGVREGDLILAVLRPGALGEPEELWLQWPSEWRELELAAEPGSELTLVLDRAGRELERTLTVEARVTPAGREEAPRLREDERVGVVLRGATEVEARAAGLPPGGGAVVVGLAASSPWRDAGVVYGDLIAAVDGQRVMHPQVVLDAIRAAERGTRLSLELVRGDQRTVAELSVSRRQRAMRDVHIPLLYRHRVRGERRETSILVGALRWVRTDAAWSARVLWLFAFGGGDTDRLERVQ